MQRHAILGAVLMTTIIIVTIGVALVSSFPAAGEVYEAPPPASIAWSVGFEGELLAVDVSSDGEVAAAAIEAQGVVYMLVFDEIGALLAEVRLPLDSVELLEVESSGWAAVLGPEGSLYLVDYKADTASLVATNVESFSLSPSGLLVYSSQGTVYEYRPQGEPRRVVEAGEGGPLTVSLSPDGRFAAVVSKEALNVYELPSWSLVASGIGRIGEVRGVAWAPDGSVLAAYSTRGPSLTIISLQEDSISIEQYSGRPFTAAAAMDGYVVAAGEAGIAIVKVGGPPPAFTFISLPLKGEPLAVSPLGNEVFLVYTENVMVRVTVEGDTASIRSEPHGLQAFNASPAPGALAVAAVSPVTGSSVVAFYTSDPRRLATLTITGCTLPCTVEVSDGLTLREFYLKPGAELALHAAPGEYVVKAKIKLVDAVAAGLIPLVDLIVPPAGSLEASVEASLLLYPGEEKLLSLDVAEALERLKSRIAAAILSGPPHASIEIYHGDTGDLLASLKLGGDGQAVILALPGEYIIAVKTELGESLQRLTLEPGVQAVELKEPDPFGEECGPPPTMGAVTITQQGPQDDGQGRESGSGNVEEDAQETPYKLGTASEVGVEGGGAVENALKAAPIAALLAALVVVYAVMRRKRVAA